MSNPKTIRFYERWFAVANPSPCRTVLVLDASDASDTVAEEMLRFASAIVKEFDSFLDRQLFFLGSSTPYPTDSFRQKGSEWRQANAGRLSLIGPVLESLGTDSDFRLLILASGRVYDCEDWPEARLSSRIRIIGFGSPIQRVPAGIGQEILPELDRVREHIDQRVVSVEISCDGFFPFFWSNPAYRWEHSRLLAEKTNDFVSHLGLLIPKGLGIDAIVTLSNGGKVKHSLESMSPPIRQSWTALSDVETRIVRDCVANGKYTCAFCSQEHASRTLFCRPKQRGSLLGQSVLPTLEPYKGCGFILFDVKNKGVKFRPHDCRHLHYPPLSVAVARNGIADADLWDHSSDVNRWEKNGTRWQQFTNVGDDVYAIVY